MKARYSEADTALAVATIADNVRRASDAHLAEGCRWYPNRRARRATRAGAVVLEFAREFGMPYRDMAAVVAICNMNNTWAGSLTQARTILESWREGDAVPPAAGLPRSTARAWEILGGVPHTFENIGGQTGDKTWNFYRNLVGDRDAVTCDRWACRAAGMPEATHQSRGGYAWLAECYRMAADEVGLTGAEAQAVAWVVIRGRAG